MIRFTFRDIIYLIGVFIVFTSINSVHAQCNYYEESLPKLQEDIASLESSSGFLEQLMQGNVNQQNAHQKYVPQHKRLASLFKVPLDNENKIASAIQLLQSQLSTLIDPLPMSDELAACADQGQSWLDLSNQRRQLESALLKQKILLLNQPLSLRTVLVRQLAMWEQVQAVSHSAVLKQQKFDENEDVLFELESLNSWVAAYQETFDSWLKIYMQKTDDFSEIDQNWLSTLTLALPDHAIINQDALVLKIPDVPDWVDAMNEARSVLFKDVSKWRNQTLLNQGWLAFISQLASPPTFFEGLFSELISAPKNFLDNLSRPFIKEYRLASKQDKQITLLLSWFSQLLGLAFVSFTLIKMASGATSWLARIQQGLIPKIQGPSVSSFISGVFWVLKPNASWVFILLAANTMVVFFQNDWRILGLIAPLGTIYAVFRGLRIIIEWGLSRTFTRSDMFLSSQAAEQLVLDSRRIAWVTMLCVFFWWLAFATGGGYSIYVISLVDIVILWFAFLWLLSKYKYPVNKLIEAVLGEKISSEKTERGFSFKLMLKVAWPLVFLSAHFVDVLSNLNQKMMVFDVYRSFSVKLLRVRLESLSEEVLEEDETEPDQSYTDWMLREVADDCLFDVGDVSGALEPLKKWFSDKTDENVTVVVGESGSGKTTFVKRLPRFWDQTPIKILDVPTKLTDAQTFYDQISELLGIESISDAGGLVKQEEGIERQVVVIDSAHNLFMAEVGYFNAYRALMQCMNAHLDNVYWVVVLNAPSWTYLSYVFSREQRVSNIFKMPRWSPMDIRKLILSRHKGGKRRLKYNNMLLSAAASSESSSIRAADSRVFNILWEQSGGNPLAAIELWLDAVKVKGRLAEVGVPERPSANLLNGMKDDLYFVYTAIVLHASLSTKEIMLVTHFSEPIVRHAVKQGINMGMIIRDESMRYKIDPYWYGSLSGFLHRKNLLWN
ncbi:MAG: hypothetical protein ACI8O8_001975 [Oleiphilaceae bacterium]|jgi:hypothetical protein